MMPSTTEAKLRTQALEETRQKSLTIKHGPRHFTHAWALLGKIASVTTLRNGVQRQTYGIVDSYARKHHLTEDDLIGTANAYHELEQKAIVFVHENYTKDLGNGDERTDRCTGFLLFGKEIFEEMLAWKHPKDIKQVYRCIADRIGKTNVARLERTEFYLQPALLERASEHQFNQIAAAWTRKKLEAKIRQASKARALTR